MCKVSLTAIPRATPAIITVGEFDLFRDEDIDYAKRLLEAGVATELHVYPGAFHVSDVLGAALPMYQRWVNGELSALENAIGGE